MPLEVYIDNFQHFANVCMDLAGIKLINQTRKWSLLVYIQCALHVHCKPTKYQYMDTEYFILRQIGIFSLVVFYSVIQKNPIFTHNQSPCITVEYLGIYDTSQ